MVQSMFQNGIASADFTTKQSEGKALIILSLHSDQTTMADWERYLPNDPILGKGAGRIVAPTSAVQA